MPSSSAVTDTSTRILDIAERLVQTRGFNAFSYANIAATLHVTKASLHYHFPTKAKLGERLINRYRTSFLAALDGIEAAEAEAGAQLRAYVGLYADVLARNRMCLCGMLAADYETLPKPMRTALRQFFDANEVWLTRSPGERPRAERARLRRLILGGGACPGRRAGGRHAARAIARGPRAPAIGRGSPPRRSWGHGLRLRPLRDAIPAASRGSAEW